MKHASRTAKEGFNNHAMNCKNSNLFSKLTNFLACMALIALTACAATNQLTDNDIVFHSFSFNTWEFDGRGHQQAEVLDYLYGDPQGYAIRNPIEYQNRSECAQSTAQTLAFHRKELKILYVKWRSKKTGEIKEVTLDLPKKLPKDFGENHRVFFSFKSDQLQVFIVTPERRPMNEPPDGPEAYQWRKTIKLYPDH